MMKSRAMMPILFSLILISAGAVASIPRAGSNVTVNAAANSRVPVLVELFTSEGCSSCPPADALLARIDMQQPIANAEAIVLEQHVDYWDDQGWKDPFASSAATRRQEDYAKSMGAEVYTPQMVIDGQVEFIGSDSGRARQAIESAASTPKAEMQLSWVGEAVGESRTLHIHAGKLPAGSDSDGAEVMLAVTEGRLHSDVRRGENAGRGLEHDGVVRELVRLGKANANADASYDSQNAVKLGKDWKRDNLRAVVFIQSTHHRRILAAGEIPF